jgi:hypothetical protein
MLSDHLMTNHVSWFFLQAVLQMLLQIGRSAPNGSVLAGEFSALQQQLIPFFCTFFTSTKNGGLKFSGEGWWCYLYFVLNLSFFQYVCPRMDFGRATLVLFPIMVSLSKKTKHVGKNKC